jgi:hypothetical protein
MAVSGNALLQSALEANWHAGDGRLPCLWGSLKARCHFFKSPFRSRAEEVLAKAEQTGMKPSFTSTPSRPRSGMSAASAATVPAVNTSPINTRQHPQSGADGRGSGKRHMYLMPFPRATPHQTDRGQSLRLAGGIPCRSSSSGLLEARRHHPRPDHIHALHGRPHTRTGCRAMTLCRASCTSMVSPALPVRMFTAPKTWLSSESL